MKQINNEKTVVITSGIGEELLACLGEIPGLIILEPEKISEAGARPAAIITGADTVSGSVELRDSMFPGVPVIFAGSVEKAPPGIDDILPPPYSGTGMTVFGQRLHYLSSVSRELVSLRSRLRHREIFNSIIGESGEMMDLFASLDRVIDFDVNVLVTGESGTGKELIARAIHEGSSRRDGPFVEVNCAGIAPDIADSLLFGHVKGAFTGANSDHTGFFEQADGGTIFLDEIGELHSEVQSKLLRVLENRKVRRVGGKSEREISFRVISATNRSLSEESAEKKFRSDLYYRLEQFTIKVPPLRERKGDIPVLARHFLREICSFYDLGEMSFSEEVMRDFESRQWPGNVRELRHHVQRLALQSMDDVIRDIEPPDFGTGKKKREPCVETDEIIPLEELERREIGKAYNKFNGEIERAAVALGISRATLYRKLKIYGIM
ncbi:MAG TPA: sigma-54 dependent transcriptional regulator [Spirochaetota bacterium]|nr:sigma-54 dependent transcriptional regulator [Spirochaetota bacterium]HPJ36010.1 sigma-54 dependent transcriptional regulator [Spirochaetota bacterium]